MPDLLVFDRYTLEAAFWCFSLPLAVAGLVHLSRHHREKTEFIVEKIFFPLMILFMLGFCTLNVGGIMRLADKVHKEGK